MLQFHRRRLVCEHTAAAGHQAKVKQLLHFLSMMVEAVKTICCISGSSAAV
jgi:hypothetical protein